jgi:predicted AAA+ superfamily ATPase
MIDAELVDLLAEFAAVMIVGPRASGKTTSASRVSRTIVHLDRELEAIPVAADPDAVLAELEPPILLDEWQRVPSVLAAVKRGVDLDPTAGRFLLTGSVRADLLEPTWAATGRVVNLVQWGLTERELRGRLTLPALFDELFGGAGATLVSPAEPPNLLNYVELALRGTFPDVARRRNERARQVWWDSCVHQLVTRDASLADEQRDPAKLRRYLTALAANNAGVVEHKTLYDAAGINRRTAEAYDALLELLFALDRVPAWHNNRLNRMTRADKRYLVDPAMAGSMLGLDLRSVLRNGDILGRLLDGFILSQLRPEANIATSRPRLHHLRLDGGTREVDLLAEARNGQVVAMECKATAAPSQRDAVHLAWLRDRLGDQFAAGVVFHTGPRVVQLGDRLHALPIASIWDRDESTRVRAVRRR